MLLDLAAAQAVVRARLLERAVHDPGPWAIRIGEVTVEAVRIRTPRRVAFVAHFDELPPHRDAVGWLLCRGEEVSSKQLGELLGPSAVTWTLEFAEPDPEPVLA